MLKMTFIFFAGIAVILVPIGMGAAVLAQVFRNFHQELYIIGGLFMLLLAAFSILGKSINLIPMSKRLAPGGGGMNNKSVFALGLFSGAATSCCAPVLAGAVTLAVVSGTFWKALIVTFAYVFGMVLPLFLAAYFYDRFKVENVKLVTGRTFNLKLGNKSLSVHSTNLLAAAIFLVMGVLLIALAFMDDAFWAPAYQVAIGEALNRWSQNALQALMAIPDLVWGALILGLFSFLAYKAMRK